MPCCPLFVKQDPGFFCPYLGDLFQSGITLQFFQAIGTYLRRIVLIPVPLVCFGGAEGIQKLVGFRDIFVGGWFFPGSIQGYGSLVFNLRLKEETFFGRIRKVFDTVPL